MNQKFAPVRTLCTLCACESAGLQLLFKPSAKVHLLPPFHDTSLIFGSRFEGLERPSHYSKPDLSFGASFCLDRQAVEPMSAPKFGQSATAPVFAQRDDSADQVRQLLLKAHDIDSFRGARRHIRG